METFRNPDKPKARDEFVPQRPHRAPWLAVWILAVTVVFLIGYLVWGTGSLKNQVAPLPNSSLDVSPPQSGMGELPRPLLVGPKSKFAENPIADIVASVDPTVVSIDTIVHERSPSISLPDLLFSKPKPGSSLKDMETFQARGAGSGIIIRSNGYILTNFHVVKDADDIKVTLNDGRVFSGHVLAHDGYSDVAVVKVDANNLPIARLGSSKAVRPGDWAIAIGSPLGLSHTVTMGIVSAVGRSLTDLNNNVDLIQTSAPINPGNSGGPLLNIRGEVIGINMAIRTDAQNIGFSLPIDTAREAVEALLHHRLLLRPYLGVSMIDFDPELAHVIGVPSNQQGVLVSKVATKSPAALSGITPGDVIERVENRPVRTGSDVQKVVRKHRVGNELNLDVFHSGKLETIKVLLRPYQESDNS